MFRIHITYFLSLAGRRSHRCCSDAVSYIHTSTTWCGLTHRQPSEGFTGGPDPAAAAAASASASVLSLPPRCWRRKWPLGPKHKCAQTPNSCGATERTHEGIRYQEVCGGNSSWWLCRWSEAQVFFFLLVSYLCLHSGLCARRRRAESKSAPMWRETPGGELTGRTHSHSLRCDITLVASDAQVNWLFFFLLFHQNSNFLVWIYDGNI